MKLAILARLVKRLGLLVIFIAIVWWVAFGSFWDDWGGAYGKFYGEEVKGLTRVGRLVSTHPVHDKEGRRCIRTEKEVIRPASDKDRADVESGNAVLVTTAVVNASCLSKTEGKIVYSKALSHFDVMHAAYTILCLVSIAYALYIVASIFEKISASFDKTIATDDVCGRTFFWAAVLILASMFLLPLWPRRFQTSSSEKAVARCREIAPPQNLDSNVKTLVDIILEKEAKR